LLPTPGFCYSRKQFLSGYAEVIFDVAENRCERTDA
jgi:hypothetical protein